jgi:hypothetical protein
MVANVAVAQDPAGNLKPAKDKSTERIDGIVALIMAIGRAMLAEEEPYVSYQLFFVRPTGSPIWPLDRVEDDFPMALGLRNAGFDDSITGGSGQRPVS